MTELIEAVEPPPPPTSHENCPFCKAPEDDAAGKASKIGADNKAKTLGDNLGSAGVPRDEVGFFHDDYGDYSPEPHHLVPGNESLKEHPVEAWLATKAKGSCVNADTGFDINSAKNGEWLPSIPDANRICKWETKTVKIGKKKKKRRFPAKSEKGKTTWSQLKVKEKDLIAFEIMVKEGLQFHKGNHRNKGQTESQCYIKEVNRLLDRIDDNVIDAMDFCPACEEPDENGKLAPPKGINEMIYGFCSAHMRWHVNGPPQSWFVFISKLARRCYQEAIDEGKTPWDIPYPGHPDRS